MGGSANFLYTALCGSLHLPQSAFGFSLPESSVCLSKAFFWGSCDEPQILVWCAIRPLSCLKIEHYCTKSASHRFCMRSSPDWQNVLICPKSTQSVPNSRRLSWDALPEGRSCKLQVKAPITGPYTPKWGPNDEEENAHCWCG